MASRSKTAGPATPDVAAAGWLAPRIAPRVAKAFLAGLALLALPAWAGPLEDANAAYERGDYAAALPLYRTLAERGDGSAQSRLGSIYLSGRGTRRNFTEALKWSRRAAALGFADAQHNLGTIYLNGFGVEQDLLEAARWFSRAAEQGHAQAQFVLAVLYSIGGGVQKNLRMSAYWFERAAVQGHAGAQADLGKMYGQGRGVPKDLVASYKWLALARTNARTAAVRTGAAKSLERLAAAMTPAQISDAQRLAREWRPVRPKGGSP